MCDVVGKRFIALRRAPAVGLNFHVSLVPSILPCRLLFLWLPGSTGRTKDLVSAPVQDYPSVPIQAASSEGIRCSRHVVIFFFFFFCLSLWAHRLEELSSRAGRSNHHRL